MSSFPSSFSLLTPAPIIPLPHCLLSFQISTYPSLPFCFLSLHLYVLRLFSLSLLQSRSCGETEGWEREREKNKPKYNKIINVQMTQTKLCWRGQWSREHPSSVKWSVSGWDDENGLVWSGGSRALIKSPLQRLWNLRNCQEEISQSERYHHQHLVWVQLIPRGTVLTWHSALLTAGGVRLSVSQVDLQ